MRKIDPDTLEKIEALIEEQDIDLDPYALEKDFHVFEAIKAVSFPCPTRRIFAWSFAEGRVSKRLTVSSGGCRRTLTSRSFRRRPARD